MERSMERTIFIELDNNCDWIELGQERHSILWRTRFCYEVEVVRCKGFNCRRVSAMVWLRGNGPRVESRESCG